MEGKIKKICIIGNNAHGEPVFDGGRLKVRLYKNKLEDCGYEVEVIDLEGWTKRVVSIIFNIKKEIKKSDAILIMAGPKGCRAIIPIVNFLNKKHKKRIVFCPLGVGTLDKILSKLSITEVDDFLNCRNFFNIRDKHMKKELNKLDAVIPQNQILTNAYKKYYLLDNCHTLLNFRDATIVKKEENEISEPLKIIFLSRISKNKGILDLLKAVEEINEQTIGQGKVLLDIYGDLELNSEDSAKFHNFLDENIRYLGILKNGDSISVISKYDIFCLPTKYHGEGTPGSFLESLFAGTTPLLSSFSQAFHLVEDRVDGVIFEINNIDDLKQKIMFLDSNRKKLKEISTNAQKTAEKYTFESNKKDFICHITGDRRI